MAPNELTLQVRARRAYEVGRLRWSLRFAPAVAAAFVAAVACGRPFDLSCALDEETERTGATIPVVHKTEAMHVEHPFALHVETLARGRQQFDLWCMLDDFPE